MRFAYSYTTAASGIGAVYHGLNEGVTLLLAGLIALAGLALAVRIAIADGIKIKLGEALPSRSTVGSAVLAGLVLTTAVTGSLAGPAMSTASADTIDGTNIEKCSGIDIFVAGVTFGILKERCTVHYKEDVIQQIANDSGQKTKSDIHSAAVTIEANDEPFDLAMGNYLNDSKHAAMAKAEVAVARAYKNGSNKTEAREAGQKAVQDYYAKRQINVIEAWNSTAESWHILRQRAENESGISNQFVDIDGDSINTDGAPYIEPLGTANDTLVNGTYYHSVKLSGRVYDTAASNAVDFHFTAYNAQWNSNNNYNLTKWNWEVQSFNNTGKFSGSRLIYEKERMDRIEKLSADMEDDVGIMVNNSYPAFQNGTIDPDDVISRHTAMYELGAGQNDSSVYSAITALSYMGLPTTTLNGTGQITVSHNNTTYEGYLIGEAPNGTWEAGTTYNGSNLPDPVSIATTGGRLVRLDGPFTVESITNRNGESVDSVDGSRPEYQTANTSEWLERMDRIQQYRTTYDTLTATGTGGGGVGGGGSGGGLLSNIALWLGVGTGTAAAILILAALAVLYIVSETSGP